VPFKLDVVKKMYDTIRYDRRD